MLKLLLLFALLINLLSQEPPKNQLSLGVNHQFTAFSITYEEFFYKYNSIECGIGFGGYSLAYRDYTEGRFKDDFKDEANIRNLMFPINYKIYLTRVKFLDASLSHTFIWNKKSITTFSIGINTNLEEGLNIRLAIYMPLSETYLKKMETRSEYRVFDGFLTLISLKLGYRF
jgi:hypothetical protein